MRADGEARAWMATPPLDVPPITAKGALLMQRAAEPAAFARGEFDELKRNFRAAQEENFKLQAVITDVTEVNKRWQKYNNDRQLYVQRLLSTIQDQQEQMNKIVESRVCHPKEDGESAQSLEQLLLERAQLRADVQRLEGELEAARREHREHVQVLEFQLRAHRDDWEAERAEKQAALADRDAAQRRSRELSRDLRALRHKFREEKLQNCSHCKCCEAHVSEIDQCNIFLPGSQMNMCRKNNAKTYRSSVHVPCTSQSPLLPRGTTIFFNDDLVVDGENKHKSKVIEFSDEVSRLNDHEETCVKSCEDGEEFDILETDDLMPVPTSTEPGNRGSNDSSNIVVEGQLSAPIDSVCSYNIVEKEHRNDEWKQHGRSRAKEINLESETCVAKSLSSLNNTSSTSASSIEIVPSNIVLEDDSLSTNGVTIGFDKSGLASVMSFSHVPIAKSSSLPEKEVKKDGVNPLVSRWSFDSFYSALPIACPPNTHNFATSEDSLIPNHELQKSPASSTLKNTIPKIRTQKVKYSEEGVATQTEEDVICPGCGKVFPPAKHLKFLDHFEECQHNEVQTQRNN